MQDRPQLTQFAWLSVATAVFTIGLKAAAYWLTGSVGLLSDALESGVNLVTAAFALIILTVAAQPPDEEHEYGHSKAEYFACGIEGSLILFAALAIGYTAFQRLLAPQPLEQIGIGLFISVLAAIGNGLTALALLRVGRRHKSLTLIANANHLLTDVWTSVGVIVGVLAVGLTDWQWLDPVLGLLVAIHIVLMGVKLIRMAVDGLMDSSLPADELHQVRNILDRYTGNEVQYHALRTRQSGAHRFISVHVQVPGAWSVNRGHALLEKVERDLRLVLPPVTVFTHLEPVDDPVSWEDISLYREVEAGQLDSELLS
ncbi:cation diffusion facilitator family transporter [Candidatus Leptofilum sp.]|uniref:cation diffusion facilitator family transporter n=1 Tax=Candidatus Leptofilum sp. TaxID=3241576 RepID=UPI003B597D21